MDGSFSDDGSIVEAEGYMCAAVEGRGFVLFPEVVSDAGRYGIGDSDAMAKRVSAATMPPIECPIKIVWTDGSIVGDGVEAATSRSMTLFWSLGSRHAVSSF